MVNNNAEEKPTKKPKESASMMMGIPMMKGGPMPMKGKGAKKGSKKGGKC